MRPSSPAIGTSPPPASSASSRSSWDSIVCVGGDREVGVELGAHRLQHLDVRREGGATVERVAHERGVLEVLGPDARDQLLAVMVAHGVVKLAGQRHIPNGSFTVSPSTVAGMKFIAGEPTKPATNRLTGSL